LEYNTKRSKTQSLKKKGLCEKGELIENGEHDKNGGKIMQRIVG